MRFTHKALVDKQCVWNIQGEISQMQVSLMKNQPSKRCFFQGRGKNLNSQNAIIRILSGFGIDGDLQETGGDSADGQKLWKAVIGHQEVVQGCQEVAQGQAHR